MGRVLNNLRNRPEVVRKNIALISAFIITIIIGAAWLSAFTSRLGDQDSVNGNRNSPFSIVAGEFKNIIGSVLESGSN